MDIIAVAIAKQATDEVALGTCTPQDFGAVANGTTDDTEAIQDALESVAAEIIFAPGTYLTTGNEVPSNKTLTFLPGAVLKLADHSNRPALQNVNYVAGTDENITIRGMYLDGNDDEQVHHTETGPYAGEYVSGIRFFRVNNLILRDITIHRAKTFGIWLGSIVGLVAENITFDQKMTGTPANQDGLHLNGPISHAEIRNLKGCTNDDMLALNADDGTPLPENVPTGDIVDVFVDGVIGEGCLNGIRMLSVTSRIDRVTIKNVLGTYKDPAINMSAYGLGNGNFGSITIDGVDCVCSGPVVGLTNPDYYGVIIANNIIDMLVIKNVTRQNADDDRPSILILASADIDTLMIDGLYTLSDTGSAPAEEVNVLVQGLVNRMVLSNVIFSRAAAEDVDGNVLQIEGASGTKGIGSCVINNILVDRCKDVILNTAGKLTSIILNNIEVLSGGAGYAILKLEVNAQTTAVAANGCIPGADRDVVEVSGGALKTGHINLIPDVSGDPTRRTKGFYYDTAAEELRFWDGLVSWSFTMAMELPADVISSDLFNRDDTADGIGDLDTGETWDAMSGDNDSGNIKFYISSNKAKISSVSEKTCRKVMQSTTPIANCRASVDALYKTESFMGIVGRYADADHWICGDLDGTHATLFYFDSPDYTVIEQVAFTAVNDTVYNLEIRMNGTALSFWVDGVQKCSGTSSFNQSATKHGFKAWWGSANNHDFSFDNFKIKNP